MWDFPYNLDGAAQEWFAKILPELIFLFRQLAREFEINFNFRLSKKSTTFLLAIWQEEKESLESYQEGLMKRSR